MKDEDIPSGIRLPDITPELLADPNGRRNYMIDCAITLGYPRPVAEVVADELIDRVDRARRDGSFTKDQA